MVLEFNFFLCPWIQIRSCCPFDCHTQHAKHNLYIFMKLSKQHQALVGLRSECPCYRLSNKKLALEQKIIFGSKQNNILCGREEEGKRERIPYFHHFKRVVSISVLPCTYIPCGWIYISSSRVLMMTGHMWKFSPLTFFLGYFILSCFIV